MLGVELSGDFVFCTGLLRWDDQRSNVWGTATEFALSLLDPNGRLRHAGPAVP